MSSALPKPNPTDLLISNANHTTIIRRSGQINGYDCVIEDCKSSLIIIGDYLSQITMDFIDDCIIIIGPTDGSIFIRNARRCVFFLSCRQFRCRDNEDCHYYLNCATKSPIIESSFRLIFHPLRYSFPHLNRLLIAANLPPSQTNYWDIIYDFTPENTHPSLPKPHYSIQKTRPKLLKFSIEGELGDDNDPWNGLEAMGEEDNHWPTPWEEKNAPPNYPSITNTSNTSIVTADSTSSIASSQPNSSPPASTVSSSSSSSSVTGVELSSSDSSVMMSFPITTSATDAESILEEFTKELNERESILSSSSTSNPSSITSASVPPPSDDSSNPVRRHSVTKAALDSFLSETLASAVAEAAAHTTVKHPPSSNAASIPSSSSLSSSSSSDESKQSLTDDDWIKAHAQYLHEDAVDDSAYRRIEAFRQRFLAEKARQEKEMQESVREIAQQQLNEVARIWSERNKQNREKNRLDEAALRAARARTEAAVMNRVGGGKNNITDLEAGEIEKGWAQVNTLISDDKKGKRDEKQLETIYAIYSALKEKAVQHNASNSSSSLSSSLPSDTMHDEEIFPELLKQLASDLRLLDGTSADAREIDCMSLIEYQHYTKEELEEILTPLTRKQKLKYRALHAGDQRLLDSILNNNNNNNSSSTNDKENEGGKEQKQ